MSLPCRLLPPVLSKATPVMPSNRHGIGIDPKKTFMKPIFLVVATLLAMPVSAQMGLALEGEHWTSVKEYPVKGRSSHINQKLSFGVYQTKDVDRSWTRGTTVTTGLTQGVPNSETYRKIISTDHTAKKQTLYFTFQDSSHNLVKAYCLNRFNAKDFNIGNNPNSLPNILMDISGRGDESSSLFYVILLQANTGAQWELLLDNQAAQQASKRYEGHLAKSKDEYYIIKPVTRIKSKKGKVGTMPFGSAGFEIRSKSGKPLAAVSLMDKGVVYLTDMDKEEKLLVSAACAALLLQEVI
jgi:hypothetical protein